MTADLQAQHEVTVGVGPYGALTLNFRCNEDSATDPVCHMVCDRSECEEGCVNPDMHPKRNFGECMVVTWLDNSDAEECVIGNRTSITLPIRYDWHGEGVDWAFGDLAALVSAHVAQVREGLADEIEFRCVHTTDGVTPCDRCSDAARIVRPSVGPREQGGGACGNCGRSDGTHDHGVVGEVF